MRTTLSAALLALALSSTAASLYDEIKPYVFPNNKSVTPEASTFLPDESATVRRSDDYKQILTCDIKTGNTLETIFDVANTRENTIKEIEGFILSPDASKILVYCDQTYIYRRSFKAHWWVYDRHSRILMPLTADGGFAREPLWSPDSRMVAFVCDDNNIHIRKTDYNTEVAVTTDGKVNSVINGATDWTYEEEFYTTAEMAWAPDNLTLCFVKFNETDVPLYSFPLYEGACEPKKEYAYYPGQFEYKYPLAGYPNSKVSLHAYDVETRRVKDIPLTSAAKIEYIPRIEYTSAADRLIVTTLNRNQNYFEIFAVNPRATVAKSIFVEQTPKGWVEPITYLDMTLYDDNFVIISDRSGWAHLYQYSYSGALLQQLTSGNFDVTAYYGYDAATRNHYFQSTSSGARNRVVSRIDEKGRVTNISPEDGTSEAAFSPKHNYATLSYSSVTTPPRFTLINPSKSKEIRLIEDNASIADRYKNMPKREFITIPADAQGPDLLAYVIYPKNFDASKKYPVILFQYSGPGSQQVLNKWSVDWENFFAMQGYIIICADPRGTAARGREFLECVYRDLGNLSTIDQIRTAHYAASLPYVDAKRVGIFGWSYGGYQALMAATQPGNPFKATVSIAPVTDWRLYDTVYTERYMSTPQQNEDGYDSSSALTRTADLSGKLLIMHGTADDNVHIANSMEFISRLIADGKYCDFFVFPNMNHSINYCNGRQLIYTRMLEWFNANL